MSEKQEDAVCGEYVTPDKWHGRWGCLTCGYSEDCHTTKGLAMTGPKEHPVEMSHTIPLSTPRTQPAPAQELKPLEDEWPRAKILGAILDCIDMAPNDDPVPYIREYVEQLRVRIARLEGK